MNYQIQKFFNTYYRIRKAFNYALYPFPKEEDIHKEWNAYKNIKKNLPFKEIFSSTYNDKNPYPNTIWIYWDKGEEQAPAIVKKCITSARKYCPVGWTVKVLNFNELKQIIELPDFIYEMRLQKKFKEAFFTDIARISLLIQYGGIWADSTVLWTRSLPKQIQETPLFFFQSPITSSWVSPIKCSSWFIRAERNNPVLIRLRNNLLLYIKKQKGVLPHYFTFHLMLSVLIDTEKDIAEEWSQIPYYNNQAPHLLLKQLGKTYSKDLWENIERQCFVQKTTYKYKKELEKKEECVLFHVLSNKN